MAIGSSRLEGGGSSGAGGRGRGAGADGRLRGEHRRPSTREEWWRVGLGGIGVVGYLDNGRVLGVGARWFGRLAHSQVLDVAASEDDVLKDVLARRDGPIGGPVLGAKGADWWGGGERQRVAFTALHCNHFHQTESEHSTFQINRGGTCFGSITMVLIVFESLRDVTVRARH